MKLDGQEIVFQWVLSNEWLQFAYFSSHYLGTDNQEGAAISRPVDVQEALAEDHKPHLQRAPSRNGSKKRSAASR